MPRPRKPTAQHELDGTFRADRHAGEPEYPDGAPPRPASVDLYPAAREAWDFYVAEMTKSGVLTVVDGPVLAHLCLLRAIEEDLVQQLHNAGSMVVVKELAGDGEEPSGGQASMQRAITVSVHPLAKELRSLTAAIRGCAADLGLTPVSRGRAGTSGHGNGTSGEAKPTSKVAQLQAAGRQLRAV